MKGCSNEDKETADEHPYRYSSSTTRVVTERYIYYAEG